MTEQERKVHRLSNYGGTIAKCGRVTKNVVGKYIFDKLQTKYKCKRCRK